MNIIVKMHDRTRVIETTRMDLHSGIMLEDDFLDISDYLNQGVLLERSVFITTSDDMQLLKRAVTIIEPDELDAIDGVYADGKPILVRTEDGSRLAPVVFEVLFDDSGNFMGDHGQGLCIYYESGSYETIVPTVLSFGDGMLMADDLIDWSDLDSGITWTRGAWTRGDRNLMELRPEPTVVVDPEQYAHMELMTFGGALVAMKTAGRWLDDMVIKAPAAMKLALGENPKLTYHERHEGPITRMATAAVIRENLAKAVEYRDKLERAAADPDEEKPEFDAKLEALLPVVRRELPVHIHAHRADDIATGIRICKEFGLEYVIVHGTEGHLIANELAREGARVITGPCLGDRSKPELANMSLETPVLLAMAGVKIAICTDHPETPVQYLPLCAAMAVKGGLPADAALAAITIWAAEIGGVAHRVGSLTPGKDGDVVVMSGHPLNWLSRVSAVVVDGRRVTE